MAAADSNSDLEPVVETQTSPETSVEMPFLDHLEELRWRILKSLAAVFIGSILCFVFSDNLMKILTYPYKDAVHSMLTDDNSGPVDAIQEFLLRY